MIEVNVNFVLIEELQEPSEDARALTRIVVIRQNGHSDFALDGNAENFYGLE